MISAFDHEDEMAAVVNGMLQQIPEPGVRVSESVALTEERSVWRCHLEGGPGSPHSVIVRTRRVVGGWRTEPSYVRTDYAATAFLWDRCPGVTAQIIAADVDAGVFVTEDLGAGPSLGHVLAGTSRSEAVKGLLAFASALGRMHAATAGFDGEYYRRRHLLGPDDAIRYRTLLGELSVQEAADRVLAAQVSGRTASRHARADAQAVLAALNDPGGLLALSNGDPCPYNCLVTNGIARLFDFELAGYRHALLDTAYLHLGFLWCYQPGRIPPDVLAEAETAYRLQAAAGIPAMLDEPVYQRELTAATTAWAILSGGMLMRHLDQGGTLVSDKAVRQIASLKEYIAASSSASSYPALTDWIFELVAAFDRQETTKRRGVYRCFGG